MNPANAIDQILRQMWPGRAVSVRVVDDFPTGALVVTLSVFDQWPANVRSFWLSKQEIESFRSQTEALDRIVALLAEAGHELGLGAPEPSIDPPVMPEVRVDPVRATRTRLIELD